MLREACCEDYGTPGQVGGGSDHDGTRTHFALRWDAKGSRQRLVRTNPDDEDLALEVYRGTDRGYAGYDVMIHGRGVWAGWRALVSTTRRHDDDDRLRRILVMLGAPLLATAWLKGLSAWECYAAWWEETTPALAAVQPPDRAVQVRRIDLCVEQWATYPGRGKDQPLWALHDLNEFTTRSKAKGEARAATQFPRAWWCPEGWTWESTTGTTYYLGKRGAKARHMRIYDKLAEAKAHGTAHFWHPYLKACGWPADGYTATVRVRKESGERVREQVQRPAPTVWRVEVEHGGDWLAKHGFDSAEKLLGCERSLWRDYTKATRHHERGIERGIKQRPVSQRWRSIQEAVGLPSFEAWTYQVAEKTEADRGVLLQMTAGCIRNLAKGEHCLVGAAFFPDAERRELTARERIGIATSRVQRVLLTAMLRDGEIGQAEHDSMMAELLRETYHSTTDTRETA